MAWEDYRAIKYISFESLKDVAQLYGIIFSMLLHFSLILHLPKIAKAQVQYHTHCQHELVFSKWTTIVKISRGFLARSAGNSDFLKIKNTGIFVYMALSNVGRTGIYISDRLIEIFHWR